jgi:hypothetical protein
MGRTRMQLLTLSCLVVVAGTADAAEDRTPAVGSLVRVSARELSDRRLTGTLLSADAREIVLALPGSERRTIARSAVSRLEWSPGFHRHPIPGAVVGGLIGGAFFGYASLALCDAASCSVSLAAVGVGVALGALPGAGIGALIRTREWRDAEPVRVHFSLAPARGRGVAARLSVQF